MPSHQEISDRVVSVVMELVSLSNAGGRAWPDMSPLIDITSSLTLANLDNWERLIRSGIHLARNSPKPPKWKFWAASTPLPTWVDLCNGDGFKRERALRSLTGSAPNSFFFAIAARRLNDWVPEVRTAVREKLLSIAAATDPADVAAVLCSIFPHWNSWGRTEASDKQLLMEMASIEAVARNLKSHIISTATGPCAEILAQVGRTPALDASLQEIAGKAVQPAVRARAYQALLAGKMVWLEGREWVWTDIHYSRRHLRPVHGNRALSIDISRQEVLVAAISDRSSLVRSVAGNVLIQEFDSLGHLAVELATRLASDKHPALSARGHFLLKGLLK